jgi:hypothetical protein
VCVSVCVGPLCRGRTACRSGYRPSGGVAKRWGAGIEARVTGELVPFCCGARGTHAAVVQARVKSPFLNSCRLQNKAQVVVRNSPVTHRNTSLCAVCLLGEQPQGSTTRKSSKSPPSCQGQISSVCVCLCVCVGPLCRGRTACRSGYRPSGGVAKR